MHVLGVPWIQLPGQQNILLQTLFTESSYSIRVTDLSNIWGEEMKRGQIKSRAEELDCAIDPDANLEDLLKHLQDALTVESASTSVILRRTRDKLQLTSEECLGRTSIDWEFRLDLLPYSAVASGLTLPLFSMMSYYQGCVKDLLAVVDEKDVVIQDMQAFCTNANLVFKQSRRHVALKKFDEIKWLEARRTAAQKEVTGAQEIIDKFSHIGREADFRKDWRAVLGKTSQWEVEFLPDTTERKPTDLTSSARKGSQQKVSRLGRDCTPPAIGRENTASQIAAFGTPEKSRIKEKKTIHTKWSSPVHSTMDVNIGKGRPMAAMSYPAESAPTSPLQSRQVKSNTALPDIPSSPVELYKRRDNRESQEIEADLDINLESSPILMPSQLESRRTISNQKPGEITDDTTDESDEALDDHSPLEERQRSRSFTSLKDKTHLQRKEDSGSSPLETGSRPETPKKADRTDRIHPVPNILNSPSPRKSNVQNIISTQRTKMVTVEAAPERPKLIKQDTSQSQIIDVEGELRARRLEKRKEAESIVKQQSVASKKRKF